MSILFVDVNAQHRELAEELEAAYRLVVDRGQFILGPEVSAFEGEFAAYLGATHGIGVDSGTSALKLALLAAGVGPGDEVILPALTFIATALAVSEVGGIPVLADIDPDTYLIDPARVERAITPRTRALIPVHLYGQPAPMDEILSLARRHKLVVIEDACQAHGAAYRGKCAGTLGHLGCFSFYPGKNLGSLGDGGMVVTNDAGHADRLRMLRNYGSRVKYRHEMVGFNHRLDEIQAAWLRVKLKRLDAWNTARQRAASWYDECLADTGLRLPSRAPNRTHVYHLYVVRHRDRSGLQQVLEAAGVQTGIHYPTPIHLLDAYRHLGHKEGAFPAAEAACREILSLPMHPHLTRDQVERVAETLRAVAGSAARR